MSLFFGNITAGKIKKISASIALALCCIAAGATAVSAASENGIELKASGSEAGLELCFPRGAAEEICSVQISVSVRSESENVYVEFIPDGGLASKINESRYQSDTGVLNIYLAGTSPLFSDSGLLNVGRVRISSDDSSASAVVGVVEDSFRFVRGGELISPEGEMSYPSPVNLSASEQSAATQPETNSTGADLSGTDLSGNDLPGTGLPVSAEQQAGDTPGNNADSYRPSGNVFPVYVAAGGELWPAVSVGGGQGVQSVQGAQSPQGLQNNGNADTGAAWDLNGFNTGEQEAAGENLNPADTSALRDVLTRADSYDQRDYSDNSYGDLNEAVNNANELLADPNATQDEIDDAMLDVENAIGMLSLRDDIPSGAEGYGAHNDDGFEGGYYNSAYGGMPGENGELLPFGQGGNYAPGADNAQGGGNDGQGENAAGPGSLLISDHERLPEGGSGVIAAVFAAVIGAAAAAVIVIRRPKKEKGTDSSEN